MTAVNTREAKSVGVIHAFRELIHTDECGADDVGHGVGRLTGCLLGLVTIVLGLRNVRVFVCDFVDDAVLRECLGWLGFERK